MADRSAEPFDRGLVEDEPHRGFRQLFAIAQEHAALAEEPDRSNRNCALVGVRQEAAATGGSVWVKVKNPKAPAVTRKAEEDWGQ